MLMGLVLKLIIILSELKPTRYERLVLLLFRRNYAVQQVLEAGTWFFQMTSTAFYMKAITHRYMVTFSIGPLVATQEVM